MNFYAISALINAITSIVLGTFVFFKNKRNSVNISFSLLSISIFFWSIFYFLWQISNNYSSALLYTRLLSLGSTLIPIFYLHWIMAFLGLLKDKRKIIILVFGYILTSIFIIFSFSNIFVKDVGEVFLFQYWPQPGYLYSVYLLASYLGLIGYGCFELWKNYSREVGIRRQQIKYIIIGTLIGFCGGATNFFLWYKIPIPPIGNFIISLYVFILFYAMIRYRLMDVRIVARKIFIYLGIATFTYGAFYFIIWFYNFVFGGVFSSAAYITSLALAPLFVFVFYRLNKILRILANRYLFASLYNYQETISKLTEELNYHIDLDKIVSLIVDSIKEIMQLNRAGVLLINHLANFNYYQVAKVIGFNKQKDISFVRDNFLNKYLEENPKLLVREELIFLARDSKTEEEKNSFLKIYEHMKNIRASLCLPLSSGKKLIGMIILGSKLSGNAYTKEDLDLLNTMSKQAAIAIENARLYKKVREQKDKLDDFNKSLQEKVDEQTKDILKQKEHLEELLAMKSDFLRIVHHQLNTPLSIMKNAFSMMNEKNLTLKEGVKIAGHGLKRMSNIILDFWDAFELEGSDIKLNLKALDLFKIIQEIITEKEDFKLNNKTDLKIVFKKPDFKLPLVLVDDQKIVHVISNLLDNAIAYTQKGKITVSFAKIKKDAREYLKIFIQDTGVGIKASDKDRLFVKFSRGVDSKKINPDGTGLGLYISNRIIDASQGELKLEKSVVGEGTIFSFTLPIANSNQ